MLDDKERIITMIKNIDFCKDMIKDIDEYNFINNTANQYSLCMALQIICENANHLSNSLKEEYNYINWREMNTTRNIISHEYGELDLEAIYKTLQNDLPSLKNNLEVILEDLNVNIKEVSEIKSELLVKNDNNNSKSDTTILENDGNNGR